MMKYIIFLSGLLLGLPFHGAGQNATDALRFSRLVYGGGARNIGVMGSLGALGADFGVLSTNPAGLAAFRRSEFFLTPGLYHTATESLLEGPGNETQRDALSRFHIQNGGLVAVHIPRNGNWKAVNFGIGLAQLAHYREKMFYDGHAPGTVVDRFVEQANGIPVSDLDGFEAGPAYDAGAIYSPDAELFYQSDFGLVPGASAGVYKRQAIQRSGYLNELQIGMAGNYDDKLYMGMTVGVPILQYEEDRIYEEQDQQDTIPFFNTLAWEEELESSGVGINLKLGLIYRINQMFRIGAAVHTPTAFRITDQYSKQLTYNFTENGNTQELVGESPEGTFDYRLYTPWRLLGNAGVVIGKHGFISAEVEWVDYASASFNFTPEVNDPAFREAERNANRQIANTLQDALHIRMGGELAYKIFRFRAGFGLSGTEYANENMWQPSWSAGLGIREERFYLDLGFRRLKREESFIPYATSEAPELTIRTQRVQSLVALTVGIKI
ncbi:MAG: hypothetical protein J5I41_08785 [Saprospiraceae bacterium]|nr:hypothetical protein [Saprospiraceae bacterium]